MASATNSTANRAVDKSLEQGGYWERGSFTVPSAVTEERVLLLAYKYMERFARILETRGLRVHFISQPTKPLKKLPRDEPDRRRYVMRAWVSRRPQEVLLEIPDKLVPDMERLGLRLKD